MTFLASFRAKPGIFSDSGVLAALSGLSRGFSADAALGKAFFAPAWLLARDGLAMAPLKTWAKDRFIARHIICVKISPEAPTMAPTATSKGSDMVKPTIAPASPENEFSRDIVMGMSAPPTLMANRMPYPRDSSITKRDNGTTADSSDSVSTARTSISTILPLDMRLWPVRTTGLWLMRLSSFAAAIRLPLRVNPPTMRASWLVILLNAAISPYLSIISAIATRAEAPPPSPLSRATI